jgi:hypothetical protein
MCYYINEVRKTAQNGEKPHELSYRVPYRQTTNHLSERSFWAGVR